MSLIFKSLLSATLLFSAAVQAQAPLVKEIRHPVADSTAHQYLLSLPKTYAKNQKRWPVILFLHGAGERGNELELTRGWPELLKQLSNQAIIVAPQIPYEDPAWSSELLSGLLDDIEREYRTDPQRLYLTGYSLGGFGSYSLARSQPHRFAALVPVAGGDPDIMGNANQAYSEINTESYCQLKQLPIWIMHGAKDPLVVPALAEEVHRAVVGCGGNAKLSINPKADHNIYPLAYTDKALLKWLLAQKNPQPSRETYQDQQPERWLGRYQLTNNELVVELKNQRLWISVKHLGDDDPEFLRNNRQFMAWPLADGHYNSQLGFIDFSSDQLKLGRVGVFKKVNSNPVIPAQ